MARKVKKTVLILLVLCLTLGGFHLEGYASEQWDTDEPITHEWNLFDLLLARPISVVAGIAGTGIFLVTLPFTIPTKSVDNAAQMLIIRPFQFSFKRGFPDENM